MTGSCTWRFSTTLFWRCSRRSGLISPCGCLRFNLIRTCHRTSCMRASSESAALWFLHSFPEPHGHGKLLHSRSGTVNLHAKTNARSMTRIQTHLWRILLLLTMALSHLASPSHVLSRYCGALRLCRCRNSVQKRPPNAFALSTRARNSTFDREKPLF